MKSKIGSLVLALVFFVVALGGCAANTVVASQSAAASASATTAASVPASSGTAQTEKTTLALMAPLTGNNKQYGDAYKNAVTMAVDKFNAAGGLNGKKVTLKMYDDKGDQKEAINVANLVVSDPTVFACVGSFGSGMSMVIAPIFQKATIPLFCPNAVHPDLITMGDMIVPQCPLSKINEQAFAKVVYNDLGGKDVAIIYSNDDFGVMVNKIFTEKYSSLGGKVIASETFVAGTTKDFTPILSSIKAKNPGCVYLSGNYSDSAQLILQAEQVGLTNVQFLCQGQILVKEFLNLVGTKADGVICASTTPSFEPSIVATANYSKNVTDFIDEYNKLYTNPTCNGYAAKSYDAANLAMYSAKAVGTDPKLLVEKARKMDIPLVSGEGMYFEPGNLLITDVYLYTIKNGEFVGYPSK